MNHLRRPGPSRAGRHGKAATVSRRSGVHEAHDLPDRFGSTWLAAWSRVQLGPLDVAGGQLAEARGYWTRRWPLSLAIHINRNMALCLVAFARLAFAEGHPELAALLATHSSDFSSKPGNSRTKLDAPRDPRAGAV
jgi:hypothetical protein